MGSDLQGEEIAYKNRYKWGEKDAWCIEKVNKSEKSLLKELRHAVVTAQAEKYC